MTPANILTRSRAGSRFGAVSHIADRVAMRAAAEAVEEPLVLDDVERPALVVMEGAEAGMFVAGAGEVHAPADHIDQPDAAAQLAHELCRKTHVLLPSRARPHGRRT